MRRSSSRSISTRALSSARPASRIAADASASPRRAASAASRADCHVGERRGDPRLSGLDRGGGRRKRLLDLGEPVDPDQPLGRGGAEAGGDEAVPAAKPAVAGDEALADRERDALVPLDHSDLREPAAQRRRRLDMGGERLAAGGQRRIAGKGLRAGPAPRRVAVERRLEIVAERGGERALVARIGLDMIDRAVAARAFDRLDQRLGFRFERGERGAGGRAFAFGRVARRGGLLAARLGGGDRLAGGLEPGFRRLAAAARGASASTRGASSPRPAICSSSRRLSASARASFAPRRFERGPGDPRLRLLGRLDGARLAELGLGLAGRILELDGADVDRAARRLGGGEPGGDVAALLLEPGQRRLGVLAQRRFALAVAEEGGAALGKLAQAAGDPVALGPEGRELVAERGRAVARRLGGGAPFGERLGRLGLPGGRGALRFRRLLDRGDGGLGLALRGVGGGRGLAPAGEDHPAFGDPDLVGELAVALGRLRLAAQRRGAHLHVGEHFVEPDEIGLGGAQFLLGVLAADVEAGNPGRFLEHQPPLGRLGGDDGADLALADQGRRMGAGGGVGEQQGDVLGAHVAAVDPVGGAGAALDPAGDLDVADRRQGRRRPACPRPRARRAARLRRSRAPGGRRCRRR